MRIMILLLTCKFKDAKCHGCGKIGHILKACTNKTQYLSARSSQVQHVVQTEVNHISLPLPPDEHSQTYTMFH